VQLPDDILFYIFRKTDVISLLNSELVCKSFAKVISSDFLWKIFTHEYYLHSEPIIPRDFHRVYYGDPDFFSVPLTSAEIRQEINKTGYWWRKHFFTYYCVHLEQLDVNYLKEKWDDPTIKATFSNMRCNSAKCGDINSWICLAKGCGYYGCGRSKNGHAISHFKETQNHFVSINLRDLEIWCYRCDRNLEGVTRSELEKIKTIENIMLCRDLHQHRTKLTFISYMIGKDIFCKFCNSPGLHVKCIVQDEEVRRARIPRLVH